LTTSKGIPVNSTPFFESSESEPLERFAVEVFSELPEDTIARRAREVNVLLRMSMLAGLEMELTSTLNLICDLAAEIVNFRGAAVYFWDEDTEVMQLRASRNIPTGKQEFSRANVLNYWATRISRPLLLVRHSQPEADLLLDVMKSASVLVVPLFVRNRVLGSLQFFGEREDSFSREDAQLLWILSLVAESMLARDYSNETLLRYAFTDFLTGLKTRGYFEQQLEMELARAERRGTPIALLMIDIDHFKRLNDTRGHHAGDLILRDLATILTRDLREVDTAARYGGEEFILLLPETDQEGAKLVAQRMRSAVEQANFFTGTPGRTGNPVEHVTISIGVALFPAEAHTKRELLDAADAALYAAKGRGRNRVILYSEMKTHREAS
jgi:diguanylate cyclase (GGDEF)-like protein